MESSLEVNYCYGSVARIFGDFCMESGICSRIHILFTLMYELEGLRSSKYPTSKSRSDRMCEQICPCLFRPKRPVSP